MHRAALETLNIVNKLKKKKKIGANFLCYHG